jgi:glycosyltransferase involved in cell wall biosynthesis
MQVHLFAEVYPSPYKPYHDIQFEELIAAGHSIKVCAFGSHPGQLSPAGTRLNLRSHTILLPSVLKDVLKLSPQLLLRFVRHPLRSVSRFAAGCAAASGWKQRLTNGARAVLAPHAAPDVCIVHNLIAQARLQFLRAIYPSAAIVFYYHGGESAGVPEVPAAVSVKAFAAANVVFTNTESSRQHAINRGCPPEKIFVSPVGFNLSDFPDPVQRRYRRDGVLNVLTVGRLSEEKGFIYALQGMRELVRSGVPFRYRVIGDGPEQAQLRSYVAANQLDGHVEFIGKVPTERLLREYEAADVLLLPSVVRGTWQENQACVVQEAMLSRAIVAVSAAGGVLESTAPEMLQFSFAPEEPVQIAASLIRISRLSDAELHDLGSKGRSFAATRYDICTLNRELLAVTERVTGRHMTSG